jgi:hypothetical protein
MQVSSRPPTPNRRTQANMQAWQPTQWSTSMTASRLGINTSESSNVINNCESIVPGLETEFENLVNACFAVIFVTLSTIYATLLILPRADKLNIHPA